MAYLIKKDVDIKQEALDLLDYKYHEISTAILGAKDNVLIDAAHEPKNELVHLLRAANYNVNLITDSLIVVSFSPRSEYLRIA
jgi:hypothetical protein